MESCRDWYVHFRVYWPVWSWCDCVWLIFKVTVIRKSIAPHQGPASSISFHVTVGLEHVELGTTIWVNPINSGGSMRWLLEECLTRTNRRRAYIKRSFTWSRSFYLLQFERDGVNICRRVSNFVNLQFLNEKFQYRIGRDNYRLFQNQRRHYLLITSF